MSAPAILTETPLPAPLPAAHYLGHGADRLRYLEAGTGSPVVLIHGSITTADEMAIALFDDLAARRRVVAFGTFQIENFLGQL